MSLFCWLQPASLPPMGVSHDHMTPGGFPFLKYGSCLRQEYHIWGNKLLSFLWQNNTQVVWGGPTAGPSQDPPKGGAGSSEVLQSRPGPPPNLWPVGVEAGTRYLRWVSWFCFMSPHIVRFRRWRSVYAVLARLWVCCQHLCWESSSS